MQSIKLDVNVVQTVELNYTELRKAIEQKLYVSDYRVDDGVLYKYECVNYHKGDYDWEQVVYNDSIVQRLNAIENLFSYLEK